MIQISMIDANDFVETVTLEGEPYKLHFSWNDFAQQWTVDVDTSFQDMGNMGTIFTGKEITAFVCATVISRIL